MRLFLVAFLFLFLSFPVRAQFFPSASPIPTETIQPSITSVPSPSISISPNITLSPQAGPICGDVQVDEGTLGFRIPSFSDILTFAIRLFFTITGIAALFMLLLGALAWVTSGGDKASVEKAQAKIQSAVVGVIMVVVVLAIMWTIENVVFNKRICIGLTCPVTLPALIKPNGSTQPMSPGCVTGTPSGISPTPQLTPLNGLSPTMTATLSGTPIENPPIMLPTTSN